MAIKTQIPYIIRKSREQENSYRNEVEDNVIINQQNQLVKKSENFRINPPERHLINRTKKRNYIIYQMNRVKHFPWLKIDSNFNFFMLIFSIIYLSVWIIGFNVLKVTEPNCYLSVSCISTILTLMALFFNSKLLKALVWVIIPSLSYTTIHWLVVGDFSLRIFGSHLLLFALDIYNLFIVFRRREEIPWWLVPIATSIWDTYLILMRFIKPSYYSGSFPYQFDLILTICTLGGLFSTILFYILNKIRGINSTTLTCQKYMI